MKAQEDQARKAAKNQALFRDVNERIEELVGEAWHPEFVCECADEHCIETLGASASRGRTARCPGRTVANARARKTAYRPSRAQRLAAGFPC